MQSAPIFFSGFAGKYVHPVGFEMGRLILEQTLLGIMRGLTYDGVHIVFLSFLSLFSSFSSFVLAFFIFVSLFFFLTQFPAIVLQADQRALRSVPRSVHISHRPAPIRLSHDSMLRLAPTTIPSRTISWPLQKSSLKFKLYALDQCFLPQLFFALFSNFLLFYCDYFVFSIVFELTLRAWCR
jgi:hypothetical protein